MPSPRTKPSLTSLVAFVFLILLVYVLSIGPLGALYDAGYISDGSVWHRFFLILYWPVIWCQNNVEPADTAINSYIDFCSDFIG